MACRADDGVAAYDNASLEELLNMKVSVASSKQTSIKESPGIITVITRDDIVKMGARNLYDVLITVPGFDFGMDTQGNLGLGIRGNWANEGKVLVLVDGQNYDEPLYSTVQYARFPVEQIEKIEIIRGPGSAMYGGNAELGVISITTRSAKSLNGGEVYGSYGQMTSGLGQRNAGAAYGVTGKDWDLAAQAFFGESQASDQSYNDLFGAHTDMNGHSWRDERNINIGLTKRDFSLRLIADSYRTTEQDQYSNALPDAVQINFPSYYGEARYTFKVSDSLKIVPTLDFNYAKPWQEMDYNEDYDKTTQRYLGNVSAYYDVSDRINLMGGAEFFRDRVDIGVPSGDGTSAAQYDTHSLFLQGTSSMDIFNFTAGARYSDNSQFGSDFVPRVALTRAFDRLRLKAMFSQSYRAPAIENIECNADIQPEHTTSEELEAGWQLNKAMDVSVDAFDIYIKDPIIYSDDNGVENYTNYPHTGTRGAELSWQMKEPGWSLRSSYSYYGAYDNQVTSYQMADSASMPALARHKIAAVSTVDLAQDWSLSPTVIFLADRNGYDAGGNTVKYPDVAQVNLYLLHKDAFVKGLSLGAGVYNMFNAAYSYIQAYDNPGDANHAPLPAPSREFTLKASYDF
jgi:outer membrane cobalamin receptor